MKFEFDFEDFVFLREMPFAYFLHFYNIADIFYRNTCIEAIFSMLNLSRVSIAHPSEDEDLDEMELMEDNNVERGDTDSIFKDCKFP